MNCIPTCICGSSGRAFTVALLGELALGLVLLQQLAFGSALENNKKSELKTDSSEMSIWIQMMKGKEHKLHASASEA